MADVRSIPSAPQLPARPLPAARAEAIRAAQRAFFDQALAAAPTSAPVPAAAEPGATSQAAPHATKLKFDASAPEPATPLRPGSLLDIKV